jgi:putative transcriptional regulator
MESLAGRFLLASAQLLDPNFVQTVVLMIEHNAEGALGVVINRPTDKPIQDLWAQVGAPPCDNQQPCFVGGPVAGPIMALHDSADLAEIEVVSGVFFAARKENLDQLVRRADGLLRLFVGHSGWGPGQLEKELEENAWRVLPATADQVFDEQCEDLWDRLWKSPAAAPLLDILKIKQIPPDLSMN